MEKYVTDIEKIRHVAKALLNIDISPTKISFVATHPFTDTWDTGLPYKKDGESYIEFIDLRDEEQQDKWRKRLEEVIEEENLTGIMLMLNKPYRLFFLKVIQEYISNKDLGTFLADTWQQIENISTDVNVKGTELVSLFKRAEKQTLMSDGQRRFLESLDDEVTVYRGVTNINRKNEKTLSWTLDRDVAIWVATRYSNVSDSEIWEVTVPKKRILASFTDDGKNGEGEVIVNLYRGKFEIKKTPIN